MRRAIGIAFVLLLTAGAFAAGLYGRNGFSSSSSTEPTSTAAPSRPRTESVFGRTPPPRIAPRPSPKPKILEREIPSVSPSLASEAVPSVLDEVRDFLRQEYYLPLPPTVLAKPTIGGMLEALDDPYTQYLTPDQYAELQARTARTYFGIGLTVGPVDHGLIVTSALNGPAREAGIRAGDIIVSIDGKPARKLPFEHSLALIKGERGTVVRLTVKRRGGKRIHFSVVRREIDTPVVRSRVLRMGAHRLGYIRILSFPGHAAEQVAEDTERLVRAGAEGLVLDLRGNPGGLLSEAVDVVSLYLDEGVVCSTVGAHQSKRFYEVRGGAIEADRPLVLLVDRGSASGAEIVAGALADNGRALLVGRRTFGKASVQSLRQLSNGAVLKLTTATYATPSGASIADRGVAPHVRSEDDPLTRPDEALIAAKTTLLGHL